VNDDIVDAGHRGLLAVLAEHRVDFVLVGGVGLQLKGYSGATRDVDVTIAVGPANETRVRVALLQLARWRLGRRPGHGLPHRSGPAGDHAAHRRRR